MRNVIAFALSLALSAPATASFEPFEYTKPQRPELNAARDDVIIELINTTNVLIPMAQKLRVLRTIEISTKAPTWEIDYPRSYKALEFNAEMLRMLLPGRR